MFRNGTVLLALIASGGSQGHQGHTGGTAARHVNPGDLGAYIERLDDRGREDWQRPEQVIDTLNLEGRDTVCDVGAGPGYFTLRLARRLDRGRVLAVDVEPRMVETLRDRLAAAGLRNVTPVLSVPEDPLLPEAACDVILVVNTYHHFPERVAYLGRLARSLKPGGRIANLDFHKRPTPHGPPVEHRIAEEEFVAEAGRAGYSVVAQPDFLPHQYFVILTPVPRPH
jgi:ubiquinone/menaquinone biosynthesis C-methylase UbiE